MLQRLLFAFQLLLVLDMLRAGELQGAEIALANLPPTPERLKPQIMLLSARLAILQGNIDEGLAQVLERLDKYRADPGALLVLIECWELNRQPDNRTMRARLKAAQPYVRFHALLSAKVNATLELIAEDEDAPVEPELP